MVEKDSTSGEAEKTKKSPEAHFHDRVIRELYRPERPKKGWESAEENLVSTYRKLTEQQRLDVTGYLQRLAMARIRDRLKRQDAQSSARRVAKRVIRRVFLRSGAHRG